MARGRDGAGAGDGDNADDDATDPSDWLASQFTEADAPAPDAAPPTFAPSWLDQPDGALPRATAGVWPDARPADAVPPAEVPAAEVPPAEVPPAEVPPAEVPPVGAASVAGVPPPFDWGFGPTATAEESVSTPAPPAFVPPPALTSPPPALVPPPALTSSPPLPLAPAPAPSPAPAPFPPPWEQPSSTDQPTELLSVAELPPRPAAEVRTEAIESVAVPGPPAVEKSALEAPTEYLGVAPPRGAAFWDVGNSAPREPTSAMDALIARGSIPSDEPVAASPSAAVGATRPALTRNQAIVGAILIVLIILVLLFLIGTRIPTLTGSSAAAVDSTPTPTATPSPTPTPTPTVVPTGPAGVGSHDWKQLRGGECVNPFVSPFAETFTVVDCTAAHAAQLVARGTFPPTTPDSYPGLAALQSQINLLCTTPAVINLATAGAYADIQVQGAYAANAGEWASGQHDYFCFVSRSSGEPLMNSVAAG